MINSREEIIQRIKDCGQSLIDNAENIANNYKYNDRLTITCYVDWHDDGETPRISVDAEYFPEPFIKRMCEF